MKTLKISKEISLPIDAVTQTLAAIGRKGSGKTYLATMIAEQMLDMGSQVVVIDPVGNWWGLRVGSDGKSKGKDIFVIGGEHGDVPLVPEAGVRIAQLLVEKNISAVLDVSSFRIGEHKRFAADFAEEFFHLKKTHKTPVHVFVEEAQKIIPQRVGPEEARMVGAFEQIVRLGRNYGIGCTLITQRPQSVNKEVLSQVECLCVLQVTGPHERKALEEWVYESGADRKLVGELPGLERGEGFVWSPSWLRTYQRVHFSKKETFDASSTPEVGKAEKAAKLSSVDVKALREDMADVVEKAEKDDPKALRRRIAELERIKPVTAPVVTTEVKIVEKPIITDKQVAALSKIVEKMSAETQRNAASMSLLWRSFEQVGVSLTVAMKAVVSSSRQPIQKPFAASSVMVKEPKVHIGEVGTESPLSKGARAILSYLYSVYPASKTKTQLWVATGYAPGGGFNNSVYELTGRDLIINESGKYSAKGRDRADLVDNFDASLDLWTRKLGKGARTVLEVLLSDPNLARSKEELAQETGYATGGGFNNSIYELTGAGLIKKVEGGYIVNPEILDL